MGVGEEEEFYHNSTLFFLLSPLLRTQNRTTALFFPIPPSSSPLGTRNSELGTFFPHPLGF
uniref:Uncharacterized protein n=1 Tax=Desertifilum tharense IPPAS B-1220 TaxID=1781255 RepID=A0ACD5GNI8_9CYAN